MHRTFVAALAVLPCYALACTPPPPTTTTNLQVVATIQPLADWARVLGGERADVHCLLAPGASAHTFEPAPGDVKRVARADLYVQVGLGLETWAERLLGASQNARLRVVTLSEGLETLPTPSAELGEEERHEGHEGHDHGGRGPDPHVWLDPVRARTMVGALAEAFAAADPDGADGYRARAAAYGAELAALDARWREGTAALRGRRVVTMHGAWTYLLDRYGLVAAATVEPFPGKEPSPAYLKGLVRLMRARGLNVLFAEPQLSTKPAEAIAREIGGAVAILDPMGDPSVPERATYLLQMDFNLKALRAALQ